MPKFKNVSPLGALDLPLVGKVVDRGEVIEVTAAQAKHLAGQDETWQPVKAGRTGQTPGGEQTPDTDTGEGDQAAPATEQGTE